MSRALARVGDRTRGICRHPGHYYDNDGNFLDIDFEVDGVIITASNDATINNRGAARLGDLVQSDCGHFGRIITCDPTITANGRGQARIGDRVGAGEYEAIIITGSPDTGT